jgi:predicted nucleic acid-binding protein
MKKDLTKCYLDTNILVYYKLENSLRHKEALFLIKDLLKKRIKIFISGLVIDEFLYSLLRFHKLYQEKVDYRKLKKALMEILNLPNLEVINPSNKKDSHLKIVDNIILYKLRPRDAYHLLIMQEQKIGYFATFDNDFKNVFKRGIVKRYSV